MTYLYYYIAAVCMAAECTSKINTDNFFEKLGLGLIGFGAIGSAHEHYELMALGIAIYLTAFCYRSFKRHRRASDLEPIRPKKRKLLS